MVSKSTSSTAREAAVVSSLPGSATTEGSPGNVPLAGTLEVYFTGSPALRDSGDSQEVPDPLERRAGGTCVVGPAH